MAEDQTRMAPVPQTPGETEPTAELVREALDQARDLVRLEVALAREEVVSELARAKTAAVALGAAGAFAVSGCTMLLVAIALGFSKGWLAALLIGGIVLGLSAAMALGGWKDVPTQPLGQTKERLGADLKQLRERVA